MILASGNNALGQTVVNTSGNTIQNNSISVEYAIGEIGIATLSGNQYHSTEGVLQPIFRFKDCNLLHFVPNGFTPNRDNLNDCFGVKNWPDASSFELSIFNRWGQLVFKTTNVLECWNGAFKGREQPADTYVYMIKANTPSCGPITKKGTITLIR